MGAKTILSILFLISVAVAGVVLLRALPQSAANAPPEEVLVAKVPLAAGNLLRAEDLAWEPVTAPRIGDELVRPTPAIRQAQPELDQQARGVAYGAALRIADTERDAIRAIIVVKPGDG